MIRRALLIGAPCWENTPLFLPGVNKDIANYHRFLRSSSGGAWEDHEITVARNPPKKDLIRFVRSVQADYVLVVFSGHGATNRSDGCQILQLNPTERILLNDVVPVVERQLIIVDACRTFTVDAGLSGFFGEEQRKFPSKLPKDVARKLFDQALVQCEPGQIICYGCERGKTSQDTQSGGYFSISLLDTTNQWVDTPSNGVYLPISHAFARANQFITSRPNILQLPRIWSQQPTRQHCFPFALRRPVQLL